MISLTTHASLLDKKLESCSDAHQRRDNAPWRTTIACIVFALTITTSFYYSMGYLRLHCRQDELDVEQTAKATRQIIPTAVYGTPAIFPLENSSNGIRASSIMRVSASDPPMVLRAPLNTILSDSVCRLALTEFTFLSQPLVLQERLVLEFTPPPEWSQRECILGILVESASSESTGDTSSLSKKSVLYRYIGAESHRDLSKPFPCGLDENVMIEFSCRGRMCIAEDNERTGEIKR